MKKPYEPPRVRDVALTVRVGCAHPDPKTLAWLFCRKCGLWRDGQRQGEPTEENLKLVIDQMQFQDGDVVVFPDGAEIFPQ